MRYVNTTTGRRIHRSYDRVMGKLVIMGNNPDRWLLSKSKTSGRD